MKNMILYNVIINNNQHNNKSTYDTRKSLTIMRCDVIVNLLCYELKLKNKRTQKNKTSKNKYDDGINTSHVLRFLHQYDCMTVQQRNSETFFARALQLYNIPT